MIGLFFIILSSLLATACGLGEREFVTESPHRIHDHGFEWGGTVVSADDTAILEMRVAVKGVGETRLATGEGAFLFSNLSIEAKGGAFDTRSTRWRVKMRRSEMAEHYDREEDILLLELVPVDVAGGPLVATRDDPLEFTLQMWQEDGRQGGRARVDLQFTEVYRVINGELTPILLFGNPTNTVVTF